MNNAVVLRLTDERIGSNDQLTKFIEKAKAITIPLFPETVLFTDTALKYGAAVVTVDTKVDSRGNNKDIYKNESGGYCLHLSKINEISQQAGIQIIDSRIIERKTDEKGRVTFIEHQVKGRLKSIDGSIKEDVATGKYDYFSDAATKSEGQTKSRRKHAEALAESNAKTRLYNKMNAKLPSSFTLEELNKPFLIPYVIEDKDELIKSLPKEDQLQLKKELARQRLGLSNKIFPAGAEPVKQIEDAQYTEAADTKPADENKGMSKEDENRINAETFRDAPQKERTEKILTLCQLKGVKNPSGAEISKKQVEDPKNTVDKQIDFIEYLLNQPDLDLVEELPIGGNK